MSYRLQEPSIGKAKEDFITEYNRNQGLKIAEGTDVYTVDDLTLKGDFLFALEPNEMMADVEVEIDVPDVIEEEEAQEEEQEQTYHKETVTVYKPIINPNWEEEQYIRREREFNKAFFNTSLGYIRRSVTMQDGSKKDFLSDLVLSIKAGLEQGLDVKILAYDKPPFDKDIEDWTIYQHIVSATPQFIMECLMQTANDFLPINEE